MNIVIAIALVCLILFSVVFMAMKLNQGSSIFTLIISTTIWVISTFSLAGFIVSATEVDSHTGGIYFFATLAVSGLISGIIIWSIWIRGIKLSNEPAEIKNEKFMENNLLYGMGGAFMIEGIIGLMLSVLGVMLSHAGTPDNSIHPLRIVIGVIWFVIPMFLMVKIPKWVKRYAKKYIS